MHWLSRWLRRFRALCQSGALDRQLDTELQHYVDERTREGIAAGLPPDEARRAALRSLGSVSRVREACREARGVQGLQDLTQDAWFALRSMVRSPGVSAIHVVLIAISIGLACSAFVVVDTVLLRSLPAIANPEQLVLISGVGPRDQRIGPPLDVYEHLAGLREGTTHIFAYRNYGGLPATIGTTTVPMRGIGIVGNYFEGLGGVPLVMGRTFDTKTDEPVAIIAEWVWREQFGGASEVLGKTFTLGSVVFSVVGVASPDFRGTQPDLPWDFITSLDVLSRARGLTPGAMRAQLVNPVARLSPGTTPAQYEARIAAAWPSILEATVPAGRTLDIWRTQRGTRVVAESLRKGQTFTLVTTPGLPRALALTAGLSALIFLASCVTLALLVVARTARNQHHTAIRLALGGSAWRVLRPQVLEAGMISLLGCGSGLLIATWASEASRSFVPGDWPIALSSSAVLLAVGMALGTTAVAAGFAAYLSRQGSVRDVLQSANRASTPHTRLRTALLAAQFAVSVILVHFTLFYIDDVAGLARAEIGLDPRNLHVYSLSGRLPQRNLDNEYFRQLVTRLRTIPGAESVGLNGASPPLAYIRDLTEALQRTDGTELQASVSCVFPGVFETWGTPRVAGRDLEWSDGPSVVVTDSLARKIAAQASPLGQRIRHRVPSGPKVAEFEVVGIVGNMAFNGPRLGRRDVAFVPCLERTNPWPSSYVVNVFIRSQRSLGDLGADVRNIVDRSGVHFVYEMEDQQQYVAWSMEREQILATLSSAFGGFILLLTGFGLFAFCSYMQTFRRRELAIRAALGAADREIASSFLRHSLVVLAAGVGAGLAITLILTRLLAGWLVDPGRMTFGSASEAALILVLIAAAASLWPTIRACRIDISRTLRVD